MEENLNQIEILFRQQVCLLQFRYYENNRLAIILVDKASKEHFATATVNVPDYPLRENEVIIKNYSETEGILDELIKVGLITRPVRYVQTDIIPCPVCKLIGTIEIFEFSMN